MGPRSLSTLLIVFFGITIAALDFAFRRVTEQAMHDRLEAQMLALISASEEDTSGGLQPAQEKTEERLRNPGSGLYGEILRSDGYQSWRSNSLTGTGLDFGVQLPSGQRQYRQLRRGDGSPVRALSRSIAWEFGNGVTRTFVYSVAEDLRPYYAQLNRFRGQLFGWFGGLMVLLLGSLAFLLRRLLTPPRRNQHENEEIEAGRVKGL